ncbi:hypothetical protein NC653_036732 [Populus alba x Populus x berolinensis]|uniref:Uncharacterized protein n=1 Tax=Populus alba x Populus x berolinensis TaxID=444605 RepID=A0AAD6PV79_9ROSI|nr:hypothetical protein NC653_036732 [Populus alba x Populus x berolinensis]
MSQLSFGKVMIVVDLLFDLSCFINILLPDGTTLKQPVLYEFLLKFYKHCHMQGHTSLEKVVTGEDANFDTPVKASRKHISPFSLDPLIKAIAMDDHSSNQVILQGASPSSSNAVATIVVASDRAATNRGKKVKLSPTSIPLAHDTSNTINNVMHIIDGQSEDVASPKGMSIIMSQRQYMTRIRSLLVHGNSLALLDTQLEKAIVVDATVG